MSDFLNWIASIFTKAFDVIISEGVLGALFVVALCVIGILAWMLYRARKAFTDYLIKRDRYHD